MKRSRVILMARGKRRVCAQKVIPGLFRLFTLSLLIACTACVQVEQDLTLYADGSGILRMEYGLSELRISDMETFAELTDHETPQGAGYTSPLKYFTEQAVREAFLEHLEHQVVLQSLSSRVEDGWKFMRMEVAFESLDGLAKTGLVDAQTVSLKKTKTGDFLYSVRPHPSGGPAGGPLASIPGLAEEFRLHLRVTIPGEVLKTNGRQLSGQTVEWHIDGRDGAEGMDHPRTRNLHVLFQAPQAKLVPFGQMRVRLNPPAAKPGIQP